MDILGRPLLEKLKFKNKGNSLLCKAIDKLVADLERASWQTPEDVFKDRPDADLVHSERFYFFDLKIHQTMILLEFENGEASVEWVGSHDEYELTFKNNKRTIEKWLRANGLIN